MAKIVVFASGDDAEKAKKALLDAGLDPQIVPATAANLLHIVIGMVDDNSDDEEETAEEPNPTDAEEVPAEEAPEDSGDGVSEALVDGELVQAVKSGKKTSVLHVESISHGPKTTYAINESKFSFWPANAKEPVQRLQIEANKHRTSIELPLIQGSKTFLSVGDDLIDLFK